MKKGLRVLISCLIFLLCTNTVHAVTYDEFKNAFWLYRWSDLEELIRTGQDDTVQTETCSIKVDESNVLKEIDGKYLGVHILNSDYYDMKNNCLKDDYKNIAKELYKIPLFRCGSAGNALSALYLPEDRGISYILPDIGYEEYEPEIDYGKSGLDLNAQPQVPEDIIAAFANNPNAEFIFNIDIRRTYPEETAQFMHFCTDANGSSYLAELRESWGIPNPVKVVGLEMGNELYFMNTNYWTTDEQMEKAVNWYINTCIKHAEALKAAGFDTKIIPCADGMPTRNGSAAGFKAWNNPVIKQLAPYIDLITVHRYYSMSDKYTRVAFDCDEIMSIIESTGKDIKIALTEHSTWDTDSTVTRGPIKRQSLGAVLDVMKFMCDILPKKEVYCANYHNFADSIGWGMIRTGNGTKGKLVKSSIAKAFGMLSDNYGDSIVSHTVTGGSIYTDMKNTYNELACAVMSSDNDTLKIILVNDSTSRMFKINFTFNSKYWLAKKDLITAANKYSFIYGEEVSDLFEKQVAEYSSKKAFTQYTMPANSFVILTLKKITQ